ncbi:MAG: dihydropteroate synthase [Candidatus Cloacimonadota bacterium]|nr:MAG: dihydropteroate synthase [Candidatus Cloacimonadota bacterium]
MNKNQNIADIRLLSLKSLKDVRREISNIGIDSCCLNSLAMKCNFIVVKISHLKPASCNIIKQAALSVGTDAAVHRDVITGEKKESNLILFGSLKEIERIAEKLEGQPFNLDSISHKLRFLVNGSKGSRYLKTSSREIELGKKVLIMGVLNVTSDSFSDGGKFLEKEKAVKRALEMVEEGADIIDIGGESSRPGSTPISLDEELTRVLPVLDELKEKIDVPISIDTYKSAVAEKALESGAEIVNDISGLRFDERMVEIVREKKAGVVIMHMQGTPKNMQEHPYYNQVVEEIYNFLKERVKFAISEGIEDKRIIVDPGIGFGKRLEDNLEILNRIKEFKSLGFPLLVGASRKSFIGHILNLPVEKRLEGSLAACAIALEGGVDIVRVHDVSATKEFIDMFESIRGRKQ